MPNIMRIGGNKIMNLTTGKDGFSILVDNHFRFENYFDNDNLYLGCGLEIGGS